MVGPTSDIRYYEFLKKAYVVLNEINVAYV